jgi:hypothetical protein
MTSLPDIRNMYYSIAEDLDTDYLVLAEALVRDMYTEEPYSIQQNLEIVLLFRDSYKEAINTYLGNLIISAALIFHRIT